MSGDPRFRDLLARVREMTLAAYARQELPFEHVMETLHPSRDPGRTPLFQVFFNVLNFADERLNRPGLTGGEPIPDDFAQFDLTLYAGKDQDQLQLQLVYCTDLFESATITRLLEHFRILLTGIHSNPNRPRCGPEAWSGLTGNLKSALMLSLAQFAKRPLPWRNPASRCSVIMMHQ